MIAALEGGAPGRDNQRVTQSIETLATSSLPRMIESIRAVATRDGGARRVDRLPDGRTAILCRVLDSGRSDVTVLGPRSRALLKEAKSVARAVAVQLKPGWAAALFGVPATELTDAFVPLEEVWGRPGRDLAADLVGATSLSEILGLFARAFAARQACEPTSAPLARRAAALLEGDENRVDHVAARLGVTPRHLRRAFAENVGVGPKEFARSVRLRRAIQMATGPRDWARVAVDAGYYDQAHLIAEFRDLVGLTPTDYARRARGIDPPALLAAMPA